MTIVRDSFAATLIVQLWTAIYGVYEMSRLHGIFEKLAHWGHKQITGSAILTILCREGSFARSWQDSRLCNGLTILFNLPVCLLHRLYRWGRPTFDDSIAARFAFQLGEETAIAESWMILGLWMIPFSRWNNAYGMLAFVCLLLLLTAGGMRNSSLRIDMQAIGVYPILFFGAVCLATVGSSYPVLSTRFLTYHIICALCVLVTVSAVRHAEDLKRLLAGASAAVLVSSAYGFLQRLQGVEVNRSYVDVSVNKGMPGRVMSFFDNPNTFAEMLILLLPLVLALVLCSKADISRVIALGVFVIGAGALGMTYSRASWIGFACGLVVLVFLWKPRLLPVFLVICLLGIPFLPDTIWNRILTITNTSDSSTASRIPLYQAAIALIKQSPVQGAGLGTAAVQKYIHNFDLYHAPAPFVHAHNMYLEVWIEAGLLGVVAFLGAMLHNIKTAARKARHCKTSAARTIACAGSAAMAGAMVCGLADYLWNYPRVMNIFWFVFAITLAAVKLCRLESQC